MNILWLLLPFILLGTGVSLFALVHHRTLWALRQEPVLRQPVLIIESDDWGPAPTGDVRALERLMTLLSHHRDNMEHPAVMTLGVVLSIPDGVKISATGLKQYHRQTLDDERFASLRQAFSSGVEQRVFSLQLHGMEHFWPDCVMAAAQNNNTVRDWLTKDMPLAEDLPPALQSRWCDATELPSVDLDAETVRQAAYEEAKFFEQIFGGIPAVAVPPTFVWNDAVEEGWAKAGVRVVISPGRLLHGRDNRGRPTGPAANQPDGLHLNSMRARHGLTYLIRNGWFEPQRGHTAGQAINIFERQAELGRPMLFETHRANFVGVDEGVEHAFDELDALFKTALQCFPGLRFCTSEQLATYLEANDPQWVENSFFPRFSVFMRRVLAHQPFHRLAVMTGTKMIARIGVRLLSRGQTV